MVDMKNPQVSVYDTQQVPNINSLPLALSLTDTHINTPGRNDRFWRIYYNPTLFPNSQNDLYAVEVFSKILVLILVKYLKYQIRSEQPVQKKFYALYEMMTFD